MKFYTATATDVGIKRKINQDCLFAGQFGTCAFAVLCDGMGGLQHGEIASGSVVAAFLDWAERRLPTMCEDPPDHIIRAEWTDIIFAENQKIRIYGAENHCTLGSTVTAMLLTETRFYVLNIGDSRAYELYGQARQLTTDHTVIAGEVALGNMTSEQAEQSPIKNVLTRCVGVYEQVYPDLFFGDTRVGAVYMLCSDGFRHYVSGEEMLQHLVPCSDDPIAGLIRAEKRLIELGKQRGETDNISVAAIYAGP